MKQFGGKITWLGQTFERALDAPGESGEQFMVSEKKFGGKVTWLGQTFGAGARRARREQREVSGV